MSTPQKSASKKALRVGYLVRSYPRLSQTFILNEILALEEQDVQVRIFSCTNPREKMVQAQVEKVKAQVDYLESAPQRPWWRILWEHLLVLLVAPMRYLNALYYILAHPEIDEGYTATSRYTCFMQAIYLVQLLRQTDHDPDSNGWAIDHLHAHFAHDPTLIAQMVHRLTGIPFTFTAHARDIYQIPATALAARIQESSGVVTCCGVNVDYFKSIVSEDEYAKLQVIHNGINLQDFQPQAEAQMSSDSTTPLILSASRLVEKKGYPDLLAACQRLKEAGQAFRCVIYGDGPLTGDLEALIDELDLRSHVTLAGACTQQELRQMMPQATVFALTPFVTADGDRDGVPTVLAEAMACGVPVVSTTVAGIAELVAHEENGLLAAPHDVETIANGIMTLLQDETKRRQFGRAARQTIMEHFNLQSGAQQLATLYSSTAGGI